MSNKFYSVKHRHTGSAVLAKAPSPALAVVAVSSGGPNARPFSAVKPATDEQVFDHVSVANKSLHPNSRERADGLKLFVVPESGAEDAAYDLIRAKNPEDAYTLVVEDAYEAIALDQEQLLELADGDRSQIVEYQPPVKRKRAPKAAGAVATEVQAGGGDQAANDEGQQADADDAAAPVPGQLALG